MNEQLEKEKIPSLFFKMAIPAVMSQLVALLYNTVDRIYIGHIPEIGSTALTGVGICTPVILAVTAFTELVGMGGAPKLSFYEGCGNRSDAENILGSCAAMLILVGILITGILFFCSSGIITLFGGTNETAPYAMEYLRVYMWGTTFSLLATGMGFLITAQGFSKITLISVLLGAGLNIILDPVFIFVFGWGVTGAAAATVVSQGISMTWVLLFLIGDKASVRLRLSKIQFSVKVCLPIMYQGLSPFVQAMTESLLSLCFNRTLLRYGGNLAVGSMTIFSTIMQFITLPLRGIAQGAQPILSYNQGAGNDRRVGDCCRIVLKTAMLFSTVMWLLVQVFSNEILGIFSSDPELKCFALPVSHIFFAMVWVMGAQFTCQMMFVALGKAKFSLSLAIFRKVILLIPLIYVLPIITDGKLESVYMAEPICDTLAAILTTTLFFISNRQYLSKNYCDPKL